MRWVVLFCFGYFLYVGFPLTGDWMRGTNSWDRVYFLSFRIWYWVRGAGRKGKDGMRYPGITERDLKIPTAWGKGD